MTQKRIKAISLFSGGLDSILVIHLMRRQNIDVCAFHITTPFIGERIPMRQILDESHLQEIPLIIQNGGDDYTHMLKKPQFGYGKNFNPCIDCKIFFMEKALQFMKENKAHFLVSGEVAGQRPMSQRLKALEQISAVASVKDLLLRPLSAKVLPPTLPEREGWVDRAQLYGISGRSRKLQMELAAELDLKDYPTPGGGCRLTETSYARKVREALDHQEKTQRQLELLQYGRHLRLPSGRKIIAGRNGDENPRIEELASSDDIILKITGAGSPTLLLLNGASQEDLKATAGICARYSSSNDPLQTAKYWPASTPEAAVTLEAHQWNDEQIKPLLIN